MLHIFWSSVTHPFSASRGGRLTPLNLCIAPTVRQRQHGTSSPEGTKEIRQIEQLTRADAKAAIKAHLLRNIKREGIQAFIKGCPKRGTASVNALRQALQKQTQQPEALTLLKAELTVIGLKEIADTYSLNYYLYERAAACPIEIAISELERHGHQNSFLVSQLHLLEQSAGLEQNPPEIAFGTLEVITAALLEQSFCTLHRCQTKELPNFFKTHQQGTYEHSKQSPKHYRELADV